MSKKENLKNKYTNLDDRVAKIIFRQIKKTGYILEKDIIKRLSRNLDIPKKTAYNNYYKIREDLLIEYNLTRKKSCKELSKKFNIEKNTNNNYLIFKTKT